MVSTMRIPETVALISLPASLVCTRVILMRFSEMMRLMTMLMSMLTSPTKVRIGL